MAKIVTHNGPFHADDVMAVALLRTFVDPAAPVVRTRDQKLIDAADYVVDVGGKFDSTTCRFDHHQFRSPAERARSIFMPKIPLSSAGMVLEHLVDEKYLAADLGEALYRELIADIDIHDNGEAPAVPEGFPAGASLSAVISRFNPTWNDEPQDFDGAFEDAVAAASWMIESAVATASSNIKAINIIRAAAEASGADVLEMNISVPSAREIAVDLNLPHKLIVHPSPYGGWMLMTVPPSREDMFSQRVPLPAAWAGLRGEALNAELLKLGVPSGILDEGTSVVPSAVFCHTGRFCGGHGTREAVMAMARAALK